MKNDMEDVINLDEKAFRVWVYQELKEIRKELNDLSHEVRSLRKLLLKAVTILGGILACLQILIGSGLL